jgi:hypothetical protein
LALSITVLAGLALSRCSWLRPHPGAYPSTPQVRTSIRQQVVAAIPHDTMFAAHPDSGAVDDLRDAHNNERARGWIQPHRNSHRDSLHHLMFLARIRVDRPYHGLARSPTAADTIWNYWVVIRTQTSHGSSRLVSAFVAPDVADHVSVRYLSWTDSASTPRHPNARAAWNHSATDSWATCSNMCCCEDRGCKTPAFAF